MKANELSVGDWVCAALHGLNGKERLTPPMRVVAIGETWVQLLVDPESGDPDEYDIEDIRPVPLTADILMANDWASFSAIKFELELCNSNNNLFAAVIAEVCNDGMLYIDIWVLKHNLRLPVPYVHTLQHTLRLAGIEKEIKL